MIFISALSSAQTKYVQPIYLIRFCRGRREEKEPPSLPLSPTTYDTSHSAYVCLPARLSVSHLSHSPVFPPCPVLHTHQLPCSAQRGHSRSLRYQLRPVVNARRPRRWGEGCEIFQRKRQKVIAKRCTSLPPFPLLVAVCQYLCSAEKQRRH